MSAPLPSTTSTTATSSTTTTTELPLFPYLLDEAAAAAAGSISAVDNSRNLTTIILSCLPTVDSTSECARLGLPIAVTTGPTTHQWTATRRMVRGGGGGGATSTFLRTDSIECRVEDVTAECSGAVGWTLSGESRVTEDPFSFTSVDYLSDAVVLAVTGGLDLLDASTTTIADTATTTTTTTSGPALPSETDTDSREDPESDGDGSASKAWIAGPVIAGLAGVLLILLLAWWIWRRREKSKARGEGYSSETAHRAELDGQVVKPVVAEMAAADSPPGAELPAGRRANLHEML